MIRAGARGIGPRPVAGQPGADVSPSAGLRTYRPLHAVLFVLTFATGIVDAATYLDLGHVFAANMTGNALLLGFAVVGAGQTSVSASMVALAAFLAGAALGGRLARGLERWPHRWVATSLGLECVLLAASISAMFFRPSAGDAGAVALLALAMGVRNATVRRIAVPDLTTTVLTATLTDLAADTQRAGGAPGGQVRRLAAVTAMLLGAAAGALLVHDGGAVLAIATADVLLLLALAAYLASLRGARLQPRHAGVLTSRS